MDIDRCINAASALFAAASAFAAFLASRGTNEIAKRSNLIEIVKHITSELPEEFHSQGTGNHAIYPLNDNVFSFYSNVSMLIKHLKDRKISSGLRDEMADYFWFRVCRNVQEEVAYGKGASEVYEYARPDNVQVNWLAGDRQIVCDFFSKTVEKYEGCSIQKKILMKNTHE